MYSVVLDFIEMNRWNNDGFLRAFAVDSTPAGRSECKQIGGNIVKKKDVFGF